jgi:hypothetical protein
VAEKAATVQTGITVLQKVSPYLGYAGLALTVGLALYDVYNKVRDETAVDVQFPQSYGGATQYTETWGSQGTHQCASYYYGAMLEHTCTNPVINTEQTIILADQPGDCSYYDDPNHGYEVVGGGVQVTQTPVGSCVDPPGPLKHNLNRTSYKH